MSIANGAGLRRSKRTRVPLAVVVNCSAPPPPLTSTVSVAAPPSLRSVSSPGFQIIRSLPLCPKTWSSASPPVSVSFSVPPNRKSKPPLAEQRVVAGLAEQLVAAGAAGERVVAGAAEQVGRRQRAVGLVERDHVVAAQAEDPDQRGVGDRRRAADDGDRAAVDQDLPGRVAADRDRCCRGCRRDTLSTPALNVAVAAALAGDARGGEDAGGEHGAGEQPAPAARGVVTSCLHRVSFGSRRPLTCRLSFDLPCR